MALDNIDELNVKHASPFPTALRFGVIGGLIGIGFGLATYLAGMQGTIPSIISVVSVIVNVVIIIYAIRAHRDNDLGGYISYGRCLGVGVLTALIMGVVSAIWTMVLFNVIDPNIMSTMMEVQMEKMESQGLSDEQIEMTMEMSSKFTSPTAIAGMALIGSPIWGLIVSLIAGAFMKKERGL